MCVVMLGAALAPALGISLGTGAAASAAALNLGMAAISTGMGVGSAALSHRNASIQAEQQARQNDINAQNAVRSQDDQFRQLNTRVMEEAGAAVDDRVDSLLQAARIKSRMRASAGEAGISGMGLDHMLRDVHRTEARNISQINRNQDAVRAQAVFDGMGVKAATESRISSQPMIERPSLLATGLKIGGSAVGGYNQYSQYTT